MDKQLIEEVMQWMTEQYGTNIGQRMAKLREEVAELDDAARRYEHDTEAVDEVLAEAADVLVVLLHLIWSVMPTTCRMFNYVLISMITSTRLKMERRLTNKDYKRTHPHQRNLEGGE